MIICKYEKVGSSVYVPHLDILREVGRAVRRASLNVAFSEGFNPHMQLFFSQPLPLGLKSVSEYFCAVTDEDPDDFKSRINLKLPAGLQVVKAARCDNANVHALSNATQYEISFGLKKPSQRDLDAIMEKTSLVIPLKTKKGISQTEIRNRIFQLTATEHGALAILNSGLENLRADYFAPYLKETLNFLDSSMDILKKKVYNYKDSTLTAIDEIYGL